VCTGHNGPSAQSYKGFECFTSILLSTTQKLRSGLEIMSEFGVTSLLLVPNWQASSLKPRAWLCCSGSGLCYPDTEEDKRISLVELCSEQYQKVVSSSGVVT